MCSIINYLFDLLLKFSPAIIGIAALYYSNKNVSRQVRLSSQIQWINEFRKEIANLIALLMALENLVVKVRLDTTNPERNKLVLDITKCVTIIQMYCRLNEDLHIELIKKMENILVSLKSEHTTTEDLNNNVNDFGTLAKRIIEIEQAKI
ncbi:MAG: hypothetical protein WCO28_04800 [Bacteroidota bacterium]